jgi:hypothetical protein
MPLLVVNSRGDRSFRQDRGAVPPLFAGLLRAELAAAEFETVLKEALDELGEDRFVAGLGKFREALALSRGHAALEQKVAAAAVSEVGSLMPRHWRVAEALLFEVEPVVGRAAVPHSVWANIDSQKRTDTIQLALDEAGRAEQTAYLPHVRNRLLQLAEIYPGDAALEFRLHVLGGLLSQRVADDREKNLRRLALFRSRLDESENPETLRGFRALIGPFADPYDGDPDFAMILEEVSGLHSTYENASALLAENRSRESLEVCNLVLQRRPGNVLFRRLKETAQSREWVMLDEVLEADGAAPRPLAEETEPEVDINDLLIEPPPSFVTRANSSTLPLGLKIAITEEAWNHLKTGLAATVALLLVVLLLAARWRR